MRCTWYSISTLTSQLHDFSCHENNQHCTLHIHLHMTRIREWIDRSELYKARPSTDFEALRETMKGSVGSYWT